MIIELLGELHPAAVHFPIALVLVAVLAEWLDARSPQRRYAVTVRFLLLSAAMMSVVAACAGLAAAATESPDELGRAFDIHRVLGLVTPALIFLTVGVLFAVERTGSASGRVMFRGLLAATAVLVVVTGYFGGELHVEDGDEHAQATAGVEKPKEDH